MAVATDVGARVFGGRSCSIGNNVDRNAVIEISVASDIIDIGTV
jgi:hypothetical protein